jgi:hypothetical protein
MPGRRQKIVASSRSGGRLPIVAYPHEAVEASASPPMRSGSREASA